MPRRQRNGIVFVFAIGFFASVGAVTRAYGIYSGLYKVFDSTCMINLSVLNKGTPIIITTRELYWVDLWTVIELAIAIVAAAHLWFEPSTSTLLVLVALQHASKSVFPSPCRVFQFQP